MLIWQYLLLIGCVCAVLAIVTAVHLDRASDRDRFSIAMALAGMLCATVAFGVGSILAAVVHYSGR